MPKKTRPKLENSASLNGGSTDRSDHWELKLYIAGQTPKSLTAFSNLKRFCEENVPGRYHIEVIDLAKNPQLARIDQILAIPTLVRKFPEPVRKIIGDLSDKQKILAGFNMKPLS
jgi:circadian clock protein KaiB